MDGDEKASLFVKIAIFLGGLFLGALIGWSSIASDCIAIGHFASNGKGYDCRVIKK